MDYMDYKDLIKQLRAYRLMILDRSMIDNALTNSANAIETLLNLLEEQKKHGHICRGDAPARETYGYGYDYYSGCEEDDQYDGMLGYMG